MSLVILCVITGSNYPRRKEVQPSKVEYTANVHGKFAECKLKQTFHITVDAVEDASYQFPVDYNSAFCDLLVKTPREDIRGRVKEKEEAKKMFDDAKREGKQAFLTEESTDRDIYKLSMCNLLKGDEIIVEYTYITEVEFSNGRNIFYIPSFISPRYGGEFIPSSDHAISAKVRLYNRISSLKCSMPDTSISFENNSALLQYNSNKSLEMDIEVTYNVEYNPSAVRLNVSNHSIVVAQVIPKIESTRTGRKELVFVLDCSGSMGGERIASSRKAICHCLEKIRNTDYQFNILRYGSTNTTYLPGSVVANDRNINHAIEYCNKINADLGGTETYGALKACLDVSKTAILITDGDTSDNEEMHKLCRQFDCLSILGIGSGINRANIKDMARNGKGIAVFSQTESNILSNMDLIFSSITTPSIKNPSFYGWTSDVVTRANPKELRLTNKSPLISDQPNIVYAIVDNNDQLHKISVEEMNYSLEVKPYDGAINPQYIGCLAAKRIIQENDINEFFTKEMMVDLAVNFNIITKYTSMIAVSVQEVKRPETQDAVILAFTKRDDDRKKWVDTYTQTGSHGPSGPMYIAKSICTAYSTSIPTMAQNIQNMCFQDCSLNLCGHADEEDCDDGNEDYDDGSSDIVWSDSPKISARIASVISDPNVVFIPDADKQLYHSLTTDPNDSVAGITKVDFSIYENCDVTKDSALPNIMFDSEPVRSGLCDPRLGITDYRISEPVRSGLEENEILEAFELLSKEEFDMNIDVLKHFDETTGLFKQSVVEVFGHLWDAWLKNDSLLTLLVLLCMRRTPSLVDEFKRCYELSMTNPAVAALAAKLNFGAIVA